MGAIAAVSSSLQQSAAVCSSQQQFAAVSSSLQQSAAVSLHLAPPCMAPVNIGVYSNESFFVIALGV